MSIFRTRSERGLTLVETLVSITVFAIMTVGIVPLLGVAMKGGAATRTESVARNFTSKSLERLRGLAYHISWSSTPRKADLLDHFFPGRTPAFALPSATTGYDAATQSFVTTCLSGATTPECRALGSEGIPAGYWIEVRATFRDTTDPTVTVPVPSDYTHNSTTGKDAPPSKLLEISLKANWTVGGNSKTFSLRSYLGDHPRAGLPTGPGGGGGGGGGPSPSAPPTTAPDTVKLRSEARIDYAVEATTTYQDTQATPRKSDFRATMGTGIAYGEQLDSGSKTDLKVSGGEMTVIRAADPLVSGDLGYDAAINAASLEAHAPPDASSTSTVPVTTSVGLNQTEITGATAIGVWPPSEAGTMTGLGGAGPKVTGGLPTVKGYYDFNSTSSWSPIDPTNANTKAHMVFSPQLPAGAARSGDTNSVNPLDLYEMSGTRPLIVRDMDSPVGADPRGEVEIHSTATTTPSTRTVYSKAEIVNGGTIMVLPNWTSQVGKRAAIEFVNFKANVTCNSKADPSYASTATGSWSTTLRYYSDDTNNNQAQYVIHQTTLPTQTMSGDTHIPLGTTNPLAHLKTLNGGRGPLVHDNSNNAADVYMFAAAGSRGLLKDWSMGSIQTSISADDRTVSASLNGAIRLETSPLVGPWGASTKPEADMTVSIGKLSCKSEDFR